MHSLPTALWALQFLLEQATHRGIHIGIFPSFTLSQAFCLPSLQYLAPKAFCLIKPEKDTYVKNQRVHELLPFP